MEEDEEQEEEVEPVSGVSSRHSWIAPLADEKADEKARESLSILNIAINDGSLRNEAL